MVAAIVDAVTDAYIVSKIFAGFRVDIAGKLMRFPARRAGKTAVSSVVRFQNVSKGGHDIVFFSSTLSTLATLFFRFAALYGVGYVLLV